MSRSLSGIQATKKVTKTGAFGEILEISEMIESTETVEMGEENTTKSTFSTPEEASASKTIVETNLPFLMCFFTWRVL